MAYKCKMCNANLDIKEGSKRVTCQFCGTTQLVENRYPGENKVKRGYNYLSDGDYIKANEFFEEALNENAEAAEAYLGRVLVSNKVKSYDEFFSLNNNIDVEKFLMNLKYSLDYKNAIRYSSAEEAEKLEKFRQGVYAMAYNKAKSHMDNKDYPAAINLLKADRGFGDADRLLAECEALARDSENEDKYNQALLYMEKKAYRNAINIFENLSEYKDSSAKLKECKYICGLTYIKSEEYVEAINIFSDISDYEDAERLLRRCKNEVNESRYRYAKEALENSANENAVENARSIFEDLHQYKDSEKQTEICTKEIEYLRVKSKIRYVWKINDWEECKNRLEALADYKDAGALAKKCKKHNNLLKFLIIPGMVILFSLFIIIILIYS